jgi:hypothetical protein
LRERSSVPARLGEFKGRRAGPSDTRCYGTLFRHIRLSRINPVHVRADDPGCPRSGRRARGRYPPLRPALAPRSAFPIRRRMPPNSPNADVLLAYCRDRLEQIQQEMELLRELVALLEARSGRGGPGGQVPRKRGGGEQT